MAGRGTKKWLDIANIVWSEVAGLYGCENGACAAGTMVQIFAKTVGWVPIHKQGGPVGIPWMPNGCGCGMLMENWGQRADKSLCLQ